MPLAASMRKKRSIGRVASRASLTMGRQASGGAVRGVESLPEDLTLISCKLAGYAGEGTSFCLGQEIRRRIRAELASFELALREASQELAARGIELAWRWHQIAHAVRIADQVTTVLERSHVIFLIDDELSRSAIGLHLPARQRRLLSDGHDALNLGQE